MRISFEALYSLDDFEGAVKRALDVLRQNGVKQVLHVNLYMSLRREGRVIDLVDENDQVIDHLRFDGPVGQTFRFPSNKILGDKAGEGSDKPKVVK